MKITDLFKPKQMQMQKRNVVFADGSTFKEFITGSYQTLADNPEIVAGCFKIAQLISSMTIYLMANTEQGDIRVVNELSRKIDILPNKSMTRSTFMTNIVMNMLLYGNGNAVVYPHTKKGLLDNLEPISSSRVGFNYFPDYPNNYQVTIDNVAYDPDSLLHFVYNPDPVYMWKGQGFKVSLSEVADNLAQAQATTKGFLQSKWKPSIIVKVDAMTPEFAGKKGREHLLEEYVSSSKMGEPWLIPAEQFSVEQVKPLSLQDLAITDSITLNKKTVASILGVPNYLLGVGEYNAEEWDSFINNTIRPIAQSIEQEMTRKLILSPKMYLMFNVSKLYSYNLEKIASVYGGLFDKGIVTGNEVREHLGMQPNSELNDLMVLENYLPIDQISKQKKVLQDEN